MTETEFRGLKLMMLEAYRSDRAIDMRNQIRLWQYGDVDRLIRNQDHGFKECWKNALREFDINPTNNLELIRNKCFKKAFNDATLQKAYDRANKDAKRDACRDEVMPLIDSLLLRAQEFNTSHREAAVNICHIINRRETVEFTFGNAQKLINMMLKYYYVLSLYFSGDTESEAGRFFARVHGIESNLHVPIDNVMLMVLRGDTYSKVSSHGLIKQENGPSYKIKCQYIKKDIEGNVITDDRGRPVSVSECSWSKIPTEQAGFDAYDRLQELCCEKAGQTAPIAWECDEWINAR